MFGLILPGRPVLTPPALQTLSPTQFAYTFAAAPSFSHLVLFILPGNELPPDVLAGVYIQFPPRDAGSPPGAFKLLGALGTHKQSAIFRVGGLRSNGAAGATPTRDAGGVLEVDMDADEAPSGTGPGGAAPAGDVVVGISIEPAATLAPQLPAAAGGLSANGAGQGGALALYKQQQQQPPHAASPVPTKVLAQRIIKNAFNFLASFAGGDEKVPLKSFEEWWRKFERKVEVDPAFLERDE